MTITIDQLGLDMGAGLGLLLRRLYVRAIPAAFGDVSAELGMDVAFDFANPRVQDVLDQLAEQVTNITDSTRADIQRLVGRAAEEGWTDEQLAMALEQLADVASRSRARLIARTEAATAYGAAQILAYRESGVVRQKEWLTGPNPCPVCEGLSGARANLDAPFIGNVQHPPAHPGCVCDVVAVL